MAKYFEDTSILNYTWNQVACAFWMRYPNPQSGHVLSEDTLHREVRSGRLYSKRLLTKTNRVPKWAERLYNAKSIAIVEESITDPRNKILITYTRNLGYTKVMHVTERVEYRGNSDGDTVVHRSAWIDSHIGFGFSGMIRSFGIERFKKNCHQMINGFNHVLHHMFSKQAQGNVALQSHAMVQKLKGVKEVARNATERAKANVYNSVHKQNNEL